MGRWPHGAAAGPGVGLRASLAAAAAALLPAAAAPHLRRPV